MFQIISAVSPELSFISYSFPFAVIFPANFLSALTLQDTTLPSFHSAETSAPPRTLSPLNAPSGYGQAGRSSMITAPLSGLDCTRAFDHRRGRAEVAVDLERRVRVEHIRERRLSEQLFERPVDSHGVVQSRVESGQPRAGPAGVSAAVGKTALNCLLRRRVELRCR